MVTDALLDSDTSQEIADHIDEIEFERCELKGFPLILTSAIRVLRFTDCTARSIALAGAEEVHVIRSRFEECKLVDQCFSDAVVMHARFTNCAMDGARFRFTRIQNCSFDSCVLTSCDFDGATLQEVEFPTSRLGATFNNVTVKGLVDLRSAHLDSIRPMTGLRGFTADVEQVVGLAVPLAKAVGILVTEPAD